MVNLLYASIHAQKLWPKIRIWTPIWDPHGLPRASKIDLGALKITVVDLPGSVYDSDNDFGAKIKIPSAVRSPPHQMSSRKITVTANWDVECSN